MFYPTACLEELMPDILIKTLYENFNTFKESFFNSLVEDTVNDQKSLQGSDVPSTADEQPAPLETKTIQHSDRTRGALPSNVLVHPFIPYCHKYGSVTLSGINNSMEKFNGGSSEL